jgi:hypothetical protein
MNKLTLLFSILLAVSLVLISACEKDPDKLQLVSIEATGTDIASGGEITKDLNGATAAVDVPTDAVITVVFNKNVSFESISSNVLFSTTGGQVSHTDEELIITFDNPLERGTDYTISFGNGLEAEDGGGFDAISRTFTTAGIKDVVPPQSASQVAYWPFNGNSVDAAGSYDGGAEVAMTWGTDRHGQVGSCATFDGNASIIEVPNADPLGTTNDFTLSFWIKTNSEGHVNADGNPSGHFVMGLGAFFGFQFEIFSDYAGCKLAAQYDLGDGINTAGEDTWYNGEENLAWQGWTFARDLTGQGGLPALIQDKWAHIVCTYNSSTKEGSMYINGLIMKTFDFDLWPEGDLKKNITGMKYSGQEPDVVNDLAFGFIHSRAGTMWDAEPWGGYDFPTSQHFKGQLDDVRIFHAALDATEIETLYNDEKP